MNTRTYIFTTLSEGVQCELGHESLRNSVVLVPEGVQCELGEESYRNYLKEKHAFPGFHVPHNNGGLDANPVNTNSLMFSRTNDLEFCELVCGDCGLQYPNSCSYERHCKAHDSEEPYRCIECSLRFKKCTHLEEHRASHLLIKLYSCSDCGKQYSFKLSLLKHSLSHGFRPQHQCATCGLHFFNADFLLSHECLHSNLEYNENVDLLKSINFMNVQLQLCEIHMDQVFPCPICEEEGNQGCSKAASSSLLLECEDCNLKFPSEDDLSCHLKLHRSPHSFKCDVCGKIYKSYSELKEHVDSSHSDFQVHWCENCGGSGFMNLPAPTNGSWPSIMEDNDDWSSTIIDKVEVIHASSDTDHDSCSSEGDSV